jgi:hypothetical protein
MSSIPPNEEAAAILSHYFAQLAQRAGLRWSERNQADIERACELLGSAELVLDELPPFERPVVSDRVTQVFEREPSQSDYERQQWDAFHRWQTERAEDERVEQARRIVTRR